MQVVVAEVLLDMVAAEVQVILVVVEVVME
jgi:hypothetical protein